MFEVIVDNIFILIPVALILTFRILNAKRKRDEAASKEERPIILKREESESSLGHWETDRKISYGIPEGVSPSGAPISKMSSKEAVRHQADKKTGRIVEDLNPEIISSPKRTIAAVIPASASFPQKLDYLPPVKKAFIFSEIFTIPVGMREG